MTDSYPMYPNNGNFTLQNKICYEPATTEEGPKQYDDITM